MTAESDAGRASTELLRGGGPFGAILLTTRLQLHPCTLNDVEALHGLWVAPGVRRHLFDNELVAEGWVREEVARSRESFAAKGYGSWCVRRRGESRLLGFVGLRCFRDAAEPQLYYGVDPPCWGKGVATEGAAAVVDLAFRHLGFTRLLASTDGPNQASVRVMERLGMRLLDKPQVKGRATLCYEITRDEYEKRAESTPRRDASNPERGDELQIRLYRSSDFPAVASLWLDLFPSPTGYHQPEESVRLMLAEAPDLFFVADEGGDVVGTVLAGWDGHRGWIYSLAVQSRRQRKGIARALIAHAVDALERRGCPKINLQVRVGNEAVVAFYEKLGFLVEERVSMGKSVAVSSD